MYREIVLTEDHICGEIHRLLFKLPKERYQTVGEGIHRAIFHHADNNTDRIHLVGGWEWMLHIALWKKDIPSEAEVFYFLRNLGLEEDFFIPFRGTGIEPIFHSLYYGKRLDILRRVCHYAKKKAEESVKRNIIRFDCHMVAKDTGQIIASSL
jgi:hypothetical protein